MTVDLARLLIDMGFLILIWAVQLVIYPSFGYYTPENLRLWHRRYTGRVTLIVLPLMFSQLLLSIFQLYTVQNWYSLSSFLIILTLWALTFLVFVPLHQSIDNNSAEAQVCRKLVAKNWVRTWLWTVLFLLSLINFLSN